MGQADGLDDLESLIGEKITVNSEEYTVLGVDGTDQNYDLLTLNRSLTAHDLKVYTGTVYDPNDYKNGIQTTITRANNEIFVYNRISQRQIQRKNIKNRFQ